MPGTQVLNLPNMLTMTRIVLIPVFITTIIYGRYELALYLFVFSSLTDALDGLLARLRDQRTPLGAFLDPLADKFTLVTSFVLFSYYGWIPKWLTITVISRDVIIVTGWMLLYFVSHVQKTEPSLPGKLAIATQFVLLCYVLLRLNYGFVPEIGGFLVWLTAALTIASGLHYIYRGLKLTGER
jgi:cardiolipin synthase